MKIPLLGKKKQGIYPLNLFFEPETEEQRGALIGTPGLKPFCDLDNYAPVRQVWEFNNFTYAVCGNKVYKVSTTGQKTELSGTIGTNRGYVWMADNGVQIMLVDGFKGYIIENDVLTDISTVDSDFPIPSSLTYQDTYFIVTDKTTGRIYISGNRDGFSWDPLDFTNAEGNPDFATAIIMDHRELFIAGSKSVEPYYNSGDEDFTFERIQGAYMEKGIGAPASFAKMDNTVFWLTTKGQICRVAEYTPKIISPTIMDKQINELNDFSDAIGFDYEMNGHTFYVITFPGGNLTWVYDALTDMWHKRASYPVNGRHRANCHVLFNGKHIIGDYENGQLYELDFNTFDDDGHTQKAVHVFPPIERDRQYIYHKRLEIEVSAGVGTATGGTSDPQVWIDWTNDKYKTWSNEHWVPIGKIGEFLNKIVLRRLGRDIWRAYRITITDAVERRIIAPYLKAAMGKK